MGQTAVAGSTLMSGETLRLVDRLVKVEPRGPQKLKGLDEPVEALLRSKTWRNQPSRAARRKMHPLKFDAR